MDEINKRVFNDFVGWTNFMKIARKVVYVVRFYKIDLKTLFNEFTFKKYC